MKQCKNKQLVLVICDCAYFCAFPLLYAPILCFLVSLNVCEAVCYVWFFSPQSPTTLLSCSSSSKRLTSPLGGGTRVKAYSLTDFLNLFFHQMKQARKKVSRGRVKGGR